MSGSSQFLDTANFFVYGTLKFGGRNQSWWPSTPIDIRHAWTWGELFETESFPAMVAGRNRVLGELWRFEDEQFDRVAQSLDELEGTNLADEDDWYSRVVREVYPISTNEWTSATATCYVYLRSLTSLTSIQPNMLIDDELYCSWPQKLD